MRATFFFLLVLLLFVSCQQTDHVHHPPSSDAASGIPLVAEVEAQPLIEHIGRLVQQLDYIGIPLKSEDVRQLRSLMNQQEEDPSLVLQLQEILDPYCLLAVHINPESRVKAQQAKGLPVLYEKTWKSYLIKIHNEAGVTGPMNLSHYLHNQKEQQAEDPLFQTDLRGVKKWWSEFNLSGLELNYAILDLFCRDAGKREATLTFDVGQGTQDLGFRSELPILFESLPTYQLQFSVKDEKGENTRARFVIRNEEEHVFPGQLNRDPPDFWFHPQVYRATGESVRLPSGTYNIAFARGPEYLTYETDVEIEEADVEKSFQLERWFDATTHNYWSGDHHIHAAGCAHYTDPSKGVHPEDMVNHVIGEDLKIGSVLTWGTGF